MRLGHYLLSETIDFDISPVWQLVVENPEFLGSIVSEMVDQTTGLEGRFVLSSKGDVLEFHRHAVISMGPFDTNPNRKEILNGFVQTLTDVSLSENHYVKTTDLLFELRSHLCNLAAEFETEFEITEPTAFKIIKTLEPKLSLCKELDERVFEFVRLVGRYTQYDLVILINISGYMSKDRYRELLRNLTYLQTPVLIVDGQHLDRSLPVIIIDQDLCEMTIFPQDKLFEV